jgi:N-acylneuraminate cytidylyltransferase/CMP-N,N'-diacetyllegionaminic acid synthase
MYYTIECARQCPSLDRVIVSTDDEEYVRVARELGADVPFIRPSGLAGDQSSKWDVFRHVVETLEAQDGRRVDFLVDLDTGVPLRAPEDVSLCIETMLSSDADVAITAYVADRNPYFNMVEIGADGWAHLVKKTPSVIVRRQDAPTVYSLSPAVYVVRRDALWQYNHWAESRIEVCVMPRERAVDIDTELDFRLVEFLMQRAGEVQKR